MTSFSIKSLRVRFAIGFSLLFTLILGTALVIIYYSFASFTLEKFHARLKDRATTTYRLLVQVNAVDRQLLRIIDDNSLTNLDNEKVIILQNDSVIYSSSDVRKINYTKQLLERAKQDSIFYIKEGENDVLIMAMQQNGSDYYLLATAFDRTGTRELSFLKWMMIFVYGMGLIIGWLATYAFVKSVIRPLDRLNKQIELITSENLDIRLPYSQEVSEVKKLAINFNRMLERLQQSFDFKKDFVHYASHELRTPLTAMIGVTENALTKELSVQQHKHILEQLFFQQRELAEMTNSLLLLSGNISPQDYPPVRLDELLFRSVDITRNLFPDTDIGVSIEGDMDYEERMMVNAHEPLLLLALNNLFKNAVMYAVKQTRVDAFLKFGEHESRIEIRNAGPEISKDDQKHLFSRFYRGSNALGTKGHGLGLALVLQIVEAHGGTVKYSRHNPYNVFSISFR